LSISYHLIIPSKHVFFKISSPDHSESEYIIDLLNKIPLNETESYKEINKLNIISLQEENQTLLEELKQEMQGGVDSAK